MRWKPFGGRALLCWALLLTGVPSQAQRTIDLQGHRGARGLLAENTLPAFALALQMGVTTLELDVVATQDDVLVISHDPALNPHITRDAQGQFLGSKGPDIRQLTFEQLQSYDVGRLNPASRYGRQFSAQKDLDGVRIPRLTDLFELVKAQGNTQVKFAIETKITPQHPEQTPEPERFVQMLLKDIKVHGLQDRVQILSFDWRTLQIVQKLAPGMPTVYITAQLPELDNLGIRAGQASAWTAGFQHAQHGSVPKMIRAAGGTHWSSFWRELDAQKVREAQSLGLKVLAWTVNDRQTMGQTLDDLAPEKRTASLIIKNQFKENAMSETRKRAKYTLEFKMEALRLVKGGQAVSVTAKVLGIPKASLDNWVKLSAKGQLKSAGDKPVSAEQMELARLSRLLKYSGR